MLGIYKDIPVCANELRAGKGYVTSNEVFTENEIVRWAGRHKISAVENLFFEQKSLTAQGTVPTRQHSFWLCVRTRWLSICGPCIFCSCSLVQLSTASYCIWSAEHAPHISTAILFL